MVGIYALQNKRLHVSSQIHLKTRDIEKATAAVERQAQLGQGRSKKTEFKVPAMILEALNSRYPSPLPETEIKAHPIRANQET